jgi:hypothetical protein
MTRPRLPSERKRRTHIKVHTGCRTCKKRRVKCDENKPDCLQCQRLGLQCHGYDPPEPWLIPSALMKVDETSVDNKDHDAEGDPEQSHDQRASISHPRPPQQQIRFVNEADSSSALSTSLDLVSPIIWEEAIKGEFLSRWHGDDNVNGIIAGKRTQTLVAAWIDSSAVTCGTPESHVVQKASIALALSIVAIQEGDRRLARRAIQKYQQTLPLLRRQIQRLASPNPRPKGDSANKSLITSTVAAGFVCALGEYSLQSWQNSDRHFAGVAMVFDALGPSCLEDEHTRQVFLDHRTIWICCDYIHRRTSLHVKPEWHLSNLFWTDGDSRANTPLQRLLDIASRGPLILEAIDSNEARTIVKDRASTQWQLLWQLEVLSDEFQSWYHIYTADDPSAEPRIDRRKVALLGIPRLIYPDTPSMITHGYYSSLKIYIALEIWALARNLQNAGKAIERAEQARLVSIITACTESVRAEAEKICASIDPLLASSKSIATSTMLVLVFFLDSAWLAFDSLHRRSATDVSSIRVWFARSSPKLRAKGFQALREPWNVPGSD